MPASPFWTLQRTHFLVGEISAVPGQQCTSIFFKFCFYSSGCKCGRCFRFWGVHVWWFFQRWWVILLIVLPWSCLGNLHPWDSTSQKLECPSRVCALPSLDKCRMDREGGWWWGPSTAPGAVWGEPGCLSFQELKMRLQCLSSLSRNELRVPRCGSWCSKLRFAGVPEAQNATSHRNLIFYAPFCNIYSFYHSFTWYCGCCAFSVFIRLEWILLYK